MCLRTMLRAWKRTLAHEGAAIHNVVGERHAVNPTVCLFLRRGVNTEYRGNVGAMSGYRGSFGAQC